MEPTPASAEPAPFFSLPSSREEGQGWWVKYSKSFPKPHIRFQNIQENELFLSKIWLYPKNDLFLQTN
jgi:hypothetical protein